VHKAVETCYWAAVNVCDIVACTPNGSIATSGFSGGIVCCDALVRSAGNDGLDFVTHQKTTDYVRDECIAQLLN
jgi:hypothetical protein